MHKIDTMSKRSHSNENSITILEKDHKWFRSVQRNNWLQRPKFHIIILKRTTCFDGHQITTINSRSPWDRCIEWKQYTNPRRNDQEILWCWYRVPRRSWCTHGWKTLLPAFEIVYNSSIHSTTPNTSYVVERAYFPRMPKDYWKFKGVDINPKFLSVSNNLHTVR